MTPADSSVRRTARAISTDPGVSPCTQIDDASRTSIVPSALRTRLSTTSARARRATSSGSVSTAPGTERATSVPSPRVGAVGEGLGGRGDAERRRHVEHDGGRRGEQHEWSGAAHRLHDGTGTRLVDRPSGGTAHRGVSRRGSLRPTRRARAWRRPPGTARRGDPVRGEVQVGRPKPGRSGYDGWAPRRRRAAPLLHGPAHRVEVPGVDAARDAGTRHTGRGWRRRAGRSRAGSRRSPGLRPHRRSGRPTAQSPVSPWTRRVDRETPPRPAPPRSVPDRGGEGPFELQRGNSSAVVARVAGTPVPWRAPRSRGRGRRCRACAGAACAAPARRPG